MGVHAHLWSWVCVYMCDHGCTYTYTRVIMGVHTHVWSWVCMHMREGPGLASLVFLNYSRPYFLGQGLSPSLDLIDWTRLSGSWALGICLLCSPGAGVTDTGCHSRLLLGWWIWTQVFILAQQVLYRLSHLPCSLLKVLKRNQIVTRSAMEDF